MNVLGRWSWVTAGLLLHCTRSGVSFDGQARAPVVAPWQVAIEADEGVSDSELGTAHAACVVAAAGAVHRGVRLSELRCDEDLLIAALRVEAARVGGAALIKLECREGQVLGRQPRMLRHCQARVQAEPSPGEGVPAFGDTTRFDTSEELSFELARQAWDVSVVFAESAAWRGRSAPSGRPPLDASSVALRGSVPVGQVIMGRLWTSCADCAEATLRAGLLVGAAHLGAATVADVRCVARAGERVCQADLAEAEVQRPGPSAKNSKMEG